ncbi:hypothetical protein [Serratia bockelmannii]|uniref:hypothetical protein n=1 Tax=Serratia bockelmannii TaxID=2703793 RepID=UPI003FA6EBDD
MKTEEVQKKNSESEFNEDMDTFRREIIIRGIAAAVSALLSVFWVLIYLLN